jgi:hypothetical protein
VLAYLQHVQQENLQRFELIQAEQQATRAWMQQMFDQVTTNQWRYGGTVYLSLARSNNEETFNTSEHWQMQQQMPMLVQQREHQEQQVQERQAHW